MKNKKNILIKIFIISLFFSVLGAHQTYATKRAIFPDGKILQPMPTLNNVHPNISGNINSTSTVSPTNEPTQNTQNTESNSTIPQTSNTKSGIDLIPYLVCLIIIFLIIFIYKKLSQKTK